MVRRRGVLRGAARTAGRTAVIAGTATAVSGRVADRQQRFAAQGGPSQATAFDAAQAHAGNDMVGRLQQLADLRGSGALTDQEYAVAKAKLLAL